MSAPSNRWKIIVAVEIAAVIVIAGAFWIFRGQKGETKIPRVEETNVVARANGRASGPLRTAGGPTIAGSTVEAFLEVVSIEKDELRREEEMERFVTEVPINEIAAALDFLAQGEGSELKRDLSRRLVRKWALEDPRAAAAWIT